MYKTVIFDFDGTLADTIPYCLHIFKEVCKNHLDTIPTNKEILATFGPNEVGTFSHFFPPSLVTQGVDEYNKRYEEFHDTCPPLFDGIIELLELIKSKGKHITMVTGKGAISTMIALEKYNIKPYFSIVKTGSPTGIVKKEKISEILTELNISNKEAIYVGDAVSDIIESKKAGVDIISVTYASIIESDEIEKMNPNKVCSSVTKLHSYFNEIL